MSVNNEVKVTKQCECDVSVTNSSVRYFVPHGPQSTLGEGLKKCTEEVKT